jgi:penicillin-binding protein 1B
VPISPLGINAHVKTCVYHLPPDTDEETSTALALDQPEPLSSGGSRFPRSFFASLSAWIRRIASRRWIRITACATGALAATAILTGAVLYFRYSRLIDARLRDGPFRDAVNIYSASLVLSPGDAQTSGDLAAELETAGFTDASSSVTTPAVRSNAETYRLSGGKVEIFPAGQSRTGVTVFTADGHISRIESNGKEIKEFVPGSPLITTLSGGDKNSTGKERKSEQRLLVSFSGIPPVLVHAIVSAEDKRFFNHHGLDLPRIVRAAYVDVRDHRKEQGASTLTMQLVRGLWLEPNKLWMRKFAEALMTIHLEREWSKEKIFEAYVNQVYLGRQAAYSIHGFGEASRVFFGKELGDISLPEAALMAGLVQRPSYFNPFRYPGRAKERRDLVLGMMLENNYITPAEHAAALAEPVRIAENSLSEARAPYFLDLVNDELQEHETDGDSVRSVHSTIDLNLQHAAEEAVAAGMQEVDKLLARRPGPKAEAALIALDPHTGEIKAIVGGRDYGRSQLNRILAKRPPGSVFKPFVYAAALNTAVSGSETIFTPATFVDDTPTAFWFGGKSYQPGNFHGEVFGTMTLRQALAKSDNTAAVRVAHDVGYNAVVQMARRAGLNSEIKATPSVALGAYQVTPLEMAGAYTVFANAGLWVKPSVISSFRDGDGKTLPGVTAESHQALDPRVAWLMDSMLEEVMRTGTAAGVRSRGFTLPAAGKTGTSHDGWFAGFTSKLLCVVWVGYDDYRDLNLEGARSALPIWTEFMIKAARMGAYKDAREFPRPAGIEQAEICADSGKLAGPQCVNTRNEYFIAGSEPAMCDLHGPASPVAADDSSAHLVPVAQ